MASRRSFVSKSLKAPMLLLGLGLRDVSVCFGYFSGGGSVKTPKQIYYLENGELRQLPWLASPQVLQSVWTDKVSWPPSGVPNQDLVDFSCDVRMTPNIYSANAGFGLVHVMRTGFRLVSANLASNGLA